MCLVVHQKMFLLPQCGVVPRKQLSGLGNFSQSHLRLDVATWLVPTNGMRAGIYVCHCWVRIFKKQMRLLSPFYTFHHREVEDSEVLKHGETEDRRRLDLWIKHIEERLQLTKNTHTGLFCEQEIKFNSIKPLVLRSLLVRAASIINTRQKMLGWGQADYRELGRHTVKIWPLSLNKLKSHWRVFNKKESWYDLL